MVLFQKKKNNKQNKSNPQTNSLSTSQNFKPNEESTLNHSLLLPYPSFLSNTHSKNYGEQENCTSSRHFSSRKPHTIKRPLLPLTGCRKESAQITGWGKKILKEKEKKKRANTSHFSSGQRGSLVLSHMPLPQLLNQPGMAASLPPFLLAQQNQHGGTQACQDRSNTQK